MYLFGQKEKTQRQLFFAFFAGFFFNQRDKDKHKQKQEEDEKNASSTH